MKKKRVVKRKPKQAGEHRNKPLRIPLPFDQALKGLLALSPEDAKAAREATSKKEE